MKMKNLLINKIAIIVLLGYTFSFGQMSNYNYKRDISKPKDKWHKIVLPDDIFKSISSSLNDIRIFGIANNTDTVEVPYILKELKEDTTIKEIPFRIINTSSKDDLYFFTFETFSDVTINHINLNFDQDNFDWNIKLEGSPDLSDWFIINENSRILSIKNPQANYKYTGLQFPDSRYRYYRIQFNSSIKPMLKSAFLSKEIKDSLNKKQYPVLRTIIKNDKPLKQTIIETELISVYPVSSVKITVKDRNDYYRYVRIETASDSIKTQNKWDYIYYTVYSGVLSSFEEQKLNFESVFAKKIKIIVNNNDNEPLQYGNIEVKGNVFELTARFDKEADYFLVYGNKNSVLPKYDLENFNDKIPSALSYLSLGNEAPILRDQSVSSPLFENKLWLWLIMFVIILLIGWFSLSMIRKTT